MNTDKITRIIVPIGITLAIALGGGAWHQALSNEHRVTAQETGAQYQAKELDANLARLLILEAKFDNILLSLGRIEGRLDKSIVQAPTQK